jgi:hypothetical protein
MRYRRGDEKAKGYRHGHRERQLTGTFDLATMLGIGGPVLAAAPVALAQLQDVVAAANAA